MSTSATTKNTRRRRRRSKQPSPASDSDGMPRHPRGQTTSLESISIQPRTPKTPRSNAGPAWRRSDDIAQDEVELSLLGEDERRQAAIGLTLEEEQEYLAQAEKKPVSTKDKKAIALLIILCEFNFILCTRLHSHCYRFNTGFSGMRVLSLPRTNHH